MSIKLCGTLSEFLSSKLERLIRMCVSIKTSKPSKGIEHPSRCQLLGYLLLKACKNKNTVGFLEPTQIILNIFLLWSVNPSNVHRIFPATSKCFCHFLSAKLLALYNNNSNRSSTNKTNNSTKIAVPPIAVRLKPIEYRKISK